jgi:hypothetical protein
LEGQVFIDKTKYIYIKYPTYDNEGHKLDIRVIVRCQTIMSTLVSTANPIYETLKYLDEDDIIMNDSDNKLLDKLDEIEREKKRLTTMLSSEKVC